jgi:hypothetical protein
VRRFSRLALALRIGKHFVPADAVLHEVHVQHAAPAYTSLYQRVFGCPVSFEQGRNRMARGSA